jgi:TRAP-type C4-dicarboxylate transport system substrate-binding protein
MAAGLAASVNVSAATTLTLGTLVPEGTSYHKSLFEMREKWRKAPGGGVNLRIYAGGKMGGEAKMVNQMRLGALDAGLLTAAGLAEIEPAVTGLQTMPMMFRSLPEVDFVSARLQPLLERKIESKGFVVLYWSDAGWVRFFSKKPMLRPDDLRKMKLFTWTGDARLTDIWKSAGFQPVPLETQDIVPMLDTGLINVTPMPPFVALASLIYERAPHMLELNWAPLIGALVIRKAAWDRIPEATRAALIQAAREAGAQNKAHGRAENDKSVAVMKTKGLTVHPVTPELEAEWRVAAEPFYPKIRGTLVPADIWDEVERLLKEYRGNAGGAAKP